MQRVFTVEAYSYASRFPLRDVAGWLADGDGDAPEIRTSKTRVCASWGEDSYAFAFDYGALALVNVPPERARKILATVEAKLPREPHPPLREDMLVEVRPGAAIGATFDRVVLPALTPEAIEVVATVLSQSASLDYYDEDIQAILDRIGEIAAQVAKSGRPRGAPRDLIRFVGAAIASQVEIISAIALLDKPDLTWEDELADRLHDRLRHNLEIAERYKAIETKLVTIREALDAFLELSSTRRLLVLEAAIVLLIVLEIVIGFLGLH